MAVTRVYVGIIGDRPRDLPVQDEPAGSGARQRGKPGRRKRAGGFHIGGDGTRGEVRPEE